MVNHVEHYPSLNPNLPTDYISAALPAPAPRPPPHRPPSPRTSLAITWL